MGLIKKFGALLAFVLSVVALILVLATKGVVNGDNGVEGTKLIFGYTTYGIEVYKPTAVLIIGFIALVLAMIVLLAVVLGQLVKVSVLEKFAPMLSLCAAALLVLAGVLFAFTVPAWLGAQNAGNVDGMGIGAGYVIAVILLACGGCLTVLPRFVK